MPCLPNDEANIVKAQIFDMSEKACKQCLFAMVSILKEHPSILLQPFRLIIEDGASLTKIQKENRIGGV
jgi:hypothetical protein